MKVWKVLPRQFDDLKSQLLFNRGLNSDQKVKDFFEGNLVSFSKELNIPGIKSAQARIDKAIKSQELIIVYGDYDVDGICASAILYKALSSLGAKVLPYIPHRDKEGYGLSKQGLEFARDSGAGVVITVDNGIVAIEQAKYAKSLGLDLIITDHHLPLDQKPEAFAIVHSTLMCGAGVAWCLIKEIVKKELATELLELAAIATVCDLIPLVGLGRVFVKEGLKKLINSKNLGIQSLALECGFDLKTADSFSIGHIIGPRLNAIGRLEHAIDALRLLCTKDPIKARKLAKLLCDTNAKRQVLTSEALEQAKLKIDIKKKIYILESDQWASGIIGLIAGRISEEYLRPAIALAVGETVSKGSARSVEGINIVEMIRASGDLLVDVGGHKGAAGFSIENKKIAQFKKRMEELMEDLPEKTEPVLEIEVELERRELTKNLVVGLADFEPFGFGNPRPLLAARNMEIGDIRTVGQRKHLKFKADSIDCIAFGLGNLVEVLKSGQLVDLAFYLEINKFNGQENLQLKVKDINFI